MDEKRTDLRTALRELAAEEAVGAGPHVGLKRLTAYQEGTLPAAERETVQEHLSLCPRCTGLLRELEAFAAAAAKGDAGPESLRQEAWDSLVRRLPKKTPVVRPIASAARGEAPPRRFPPFAVAAAAALLLAVAGLTWWAVVTVRQQRQQVIRLEQRLKERDTSIAALQRSLVEAERQLATRGGTSDIEKERLARKVAELSATLAEIRAKAKQPERPDQLALASPQVEVSIAPRFALRGQEPPDGDLLRSGGVVNPVRTSPGKGRLAMALNLAGHSDYREYRLELLDRNSALLWAGHRPASSLLGDAGTSVTVVGLGPGLYRLRIEGLEPDGSKLLAEYLLEVEPR